MSAMDEVYAQIPHEASEGPVSTIAQISDTETMHLEAHRIRAESSIDVPSIIRGDLNKLNSIIVELASQMLPQLMKMYFDTIDQVTERTGNRVESQGDLVEVYIAAIEKIDVQFNKDGQPRNIQFTASPEGANRMADALANMNRSQAARLDEVLQRKREEYNASRRSRRLPRLG